VAATVHGAVAATVHGAVAATVHGAVAATGIFLHFNNSKCLTELDLVRPSPFSLWTPSGYIAANGKILQAQIGED
jgi:hypothetical protein